jgi:hypothetical protein
MKRREMHYSIFMNLKKMLLLLCSCAIFSAGSVASAVERIQTDEAAVFFEKPLKSVAVEVAGIYPDMKEELEKTFERDIHFRPSIILTGERDRFIRMAGSNFIVAFAVPDRNLIVIDTSRVYTKPFTLGSTLKHELCHLVLHGDISNENLPRWFDEGVCQWASGGVAELVSGEGEGALSNAVMSGREIGLNNLERFPADDRSLILAYEESKSVVEYIATEYGKDGVLRIIRYLQDGNSVNDALQKSFSIGIPGLEKNWHSYLRRKYTWASYLSSNLYTILFAFAALITVYGFVRLLKKKRDYMDEEEQ